MASYTAARDRQIEDQTSEHLSFLAHELRNPVTTLSLALQILKRRLPDDDRRTAEVMGSNLERIMDLIDRQLVALRLEAGVPLHAEGLDARALLERAAATLEPNAQEKRQQLVVECPPQLSLWGDPRLINSVLANLVGNAIKFSPEDATIRLIGRREAGRVVLGVADACGGISEAALARIFEPFVQVSADRSGHGLGLAIVRQAVEAHHGVLEVHNVAGQGCEFSATFPDGAAAPA